MANIALLNYCNLSCPYCFANEFITNEKKQILTLEQLDKILDFLAKGQFNNRIGIIGGEPTLHPQFDTIVKTIITFSKKYHLPRPTIFSNGIELGKYARLLENAACLINLNSPETIGNEKWNKILNSLNQIEACGFIEHISFGINLYENMPSSYEYLFNLCHLYNKDDIRCSLVAPTCQMDSNDKMAYYNKGKILFLDFVQKAAKEDFSVHLDCNHVPECFFNEEEKKLLNNVDSKNSFCSPVIDISPNGEVRSCFGSNNIYNIYDFEDIEHLSRFLLLKEIYPKSQLNISGNCKNCEKHKSLLCQGGCLCFAK